MLWVAALFGGLALGGCSDAAASPESEPAVITLEPFIVNLADVDERRYLLATVRVVLASSAAVEQTEKQDPGSTRLRDRILTVLGAKHADEVTSFEGKEALRAEIRREAQELFPDTDVADVLFTEFLVQ